jgi:hypothetical protein
MVKLKSIASSSEVKELLSQDRDMLRELVREVVQQTLEAEMEAVLGAGKSERSEARIGYRSGYYRRNLITRVGILELRVPQDRQGRFSTEVFERYQRSEKALVSTLAEMYVQGVSTRKVKAITEELCGYEFSASAVSNMVKRLDEQLSEFAGRRLEDAFPYLILDARYEKVRDSGAIRSRAVLIAIGIDWDGRRQILGVELSNRETATSWKRVVCVKFCKLFSHDMWFGNIPVAIILVLSPRRRHPRPSPADAMSRSQGGGVKGALRPKALPLTPPPRPASMRARWTRASDDKAADSYAANFIISCFLCSVSSFISR